MAVEEQNLASSSAGMELQERQTAFYVKIQMF